MYDLDGNGFIAKEELFTVLKMIVGAHAHLSEEQLMSIAEQTLKEADENKDNLISFEDFCQVLKRLDIEQKMSMRFLGWNDNFGNIWLISMGTDRPAFELQIREKSLIIFLLFWTNI